MLRNRLKAFRNNRSGTVMIYAALAMPVMVGGMGLGGEAGYRYYNQRILQHAADFSAFTGAVRLYRGDEKTKIDEAAMNVAKGSEYDNDVGTITVNIPPKSGSFTGDLTAVEVILEETRPRLFSAVFSQEPVIINARAVAAVTGQEQPACILALSETASGALTVTGSTDVTLTGCSVASNSKAADSFDMSGQGGSLTTDCVQTVGESTTTSNLEMKCEGVLEGADPIKDPYWWIKWPDPNDDNIPCQNTFKNGKVGKPNQLTDVIPSENWTHHGDTVLPVMRFCDGLDVKGDVDFRPGLYIIEGGRFTVSGTTTPTMSGDEVTFYLTNGGKADIGASAQLDLEAPTAEDHPYMGILFFGDGEDETHKISGNSTSTLTGAIYFPESHLVFTGNSDGSSGCTQVIADTVELTGSSALASDCSDAGTKELLLAEIISIVE